MLGELPRTPEQMREFRRDCLRESWKKRKHIIDGVKGRLSLHTHVKRSCKIEERARLLRKAREIEAQQGYSQSEIHLLKAFLEGDMECFDKWYDKDASNGTQMFESVWDSIRDPQIRTQMEEQPMHKILL